MPKVSVVIPTYQHAHFVAQAISSVLSQTYCDLEVIVVDDGSTDDTQEIVAGFGEQIRVVQHEKNSGLSAARNTGIQLSRGEYVAFLDADDIWLPEKLEKQIPLFERDESVGLVSSDMFFLDEDGLKMCKSGQRPETGFDQRVLCPGESNPGHARQPTVLFTGFGAEFQRDFGIFTGGHSVF